MMINPNITVEERVKRKAVEDLILDQDLEEGNNNNKMELEVTLNNEQHIHLK